MNNLGIENESNKKKLIQSLIQLKHRCQNLSNKELSFPLQATDIFLIAPLNLHEFQFYYQDILNTLKITGSEHLILKKELAKFPEIKSGRYEISVFKRTILIIIALLVFFPLGILIYYVVLSRRGELKSKLTEITNTSHHLIQMIQK